MTTRIKQLTTLIRRGRCDAAVSRRLVGRLPRPTVDLRRHPPAKLALTESLEAPEIEGATQPAERIAQLMRLDRYEPAGAGRGEVGCPYTGMLLAAPKIRRSRLRPCFV